MSSFELSAKSSDWLNKSLAKVDLEKLKQVVYGDIQLVKENDGRILNTAVSGETNPEQIEVLLDALAGLTVHDVYAADEVSELFTIDSDLSYQLNFTDGSEKTMKLAKYDNAYVLKMSDSDLFFKVESWQVDKINEFDLAKLTKAESEAADAGTPKAQEQS